MKSCNAIEKSTVADYLAHSNATAEKHYRLAWPDTIHFSLSCFSASFCRRQPTLHRIEKRIGQQGWTTNIPSATNINEMWKLEVSMEDIPQDKYIQRYVSSQKWKGLVVCDDIPGKGRGVYTSRRFQKGEVVCDYHGENISSKEGELKMKNPTYSPSVSTDTGEGPRDIMLFIAKNDIDTNKELLFDYGVRRKSFKARRIPIPWLSNKPSPH
uniref:SET domain-containing protein n=1 Tax=Erpetoichthys calabaricus TaxID=27687 RepID=A0A8C4TMF8_ERPCA